jgi:hypothetical protein
LIEIKTGWGYAQLVALLSIGRRTVFIEVKGRSCACSDLVRERVELR